jgi:hypothetical protein
MVLTASVGAQVAQALARVLSTTSDSPFPAYCQYSRPLLPEALSLLSTRAQSLTSVERENVAVALGELFARCPNLLALTTSLLPGLRHLDRVASLSGEPLLRLCRASFRLFRASPALAQSCVWSPLLSVGSSADSEATRWFATSALAIVLALSPAARAERLTRNRCSYALESQHQYDKDLITESAGLFATNGESEQAVGSTPLSTDSFFVPLDASESALADLDMAVERSAPVLVSGPPSCGKSALIDECLRRRRGVAAAPLLRLQLDESSDLRWDTTVYLW